MFRKKTPEQIACEAHKAFLEDKNISYDVKKTVDISDFENAFDWKAFEGYDFNEPADSVVHFIALTINSVDDVVVRHTTKPVDFEYIVYHWIDRGELTREYGNITVSSVERLLSDIEDGDFFDKHTFKNAMLHNASVYCGGADFNDFVGALKYFKSLDFVDLQLRNVVQSLVIAWINDLDDYAFRFGKCDNLDDCRKAIWKEFNTAKQVAERYNNNADILNAVIRQVNKLAEE